MVVLIGFDSLIVFNVSSIFFRHDVIIRKVLNLVNNDLKTVIRLAGTGTKHLGIRQKQRRRIENLPSSDVSLRRGSGVSIFYCRSALTGSVITLAKLFRKAKTSRNHCSITISLCRKPRCTFFGDVFLLKDSPLGIVLWK